MKKILTLIYLILSLNAWSYTKVGDTSGTVISPVTQAQQDAITNLVGGLLVYNKDTNLYNFFNSISWDVLGAGGGGSGAGGGARQTYAAQGYGVQSANNLSLFNFTRPYQATGNGCFTITNTPADGFKIDMISNCLVTIAFTTSFADTSYGVGLTSNPTAAELDLSFSAVPSTKWLCNAAVMGVIGDAAGCSWSGSSNLGQEIYIQGALAPNVSEPEKYMVSIVGWKSGSGEVSSATPTSVPGNIVIYDGTDGFTITDSGIAISDVPTLLATPTIANLPFITTAGSKELATAAYSIPPIGGTIGQILTYSALNQATWMDSPVSLPPDGGVTDLVLLSNGLETGKWLGAGTTGQILTQTGANTVAWVNPAISITTPNPTTVNRVTLWGNNTGTNLIQTLYTFPIPDGTPGQILQTGGAGVVSWADIPPTITTPSPTIVNQLAQFNSTDGKVLKNTAWTVPTAIGGLNQFLTVVGGQDTAWTSLPASIVYVGGAPVVAGNIPIFGGTAGTQIVDSGIATSTMGNVRGPAVSVINTVASYANTTGDLLRGGEIEYLDIDTVGANPPYLSGRLFWNDSAKAMAYYPNVSGPIMDIGQKIWIQCRNNTGVTLNTGQVVRVTGSIGNIPTVGLAQANTPILSSAIAAVAAPILNNTNGFCTTFGLIRNMDTSAFVEGDLVYLSPTVPGGITTVKPATNVVKMGRIINAHPTLGQFGVNPEAIPNTQAVVTSPAALIAGGTITLSGEGNQIIRITSAADITLAAVTFTGSFVDGSKITIINVGNFIITVPFNNTAQGSFLGFGNANIPSNGVLDVFVDVTSLRVREENRSF